MSSILRRLHSEWPRARMLVGSGWCWWRAELSWLVAPLSRRFGRPAESAFLVARADGELSVPASDQRTEREPSDNNSTPPVNWQMLCIGRQTFVSLDAAQVVRLPIILPRTALPSMKEAVKYRLITESPLPPDQLCFDVRITPQDHAGAKQRDVVTDVAICRRSTVEALSKTLEAAGVSASVIGFSPGSRPPLDFVFLTSRGAREARATVRTNRLLAISACLIGLSVFPATYLGARWLTAQTLGEIAAAREGQDGRMPLYEQQALVRAAQRELVSLVAAPRLSDVLNDVAAHLPRTAWLHVVRFENGMLRMNGYASDPAAAARSLESASLLSRAKLDTVTGGGEGQGSAPVQFELSASVARRALP